MGQLLAEVQVRTTAQHIWAVASHDLQYKKEDSVPKELRRSIHRISALLETVDLEFERLLAQRDIYRQSVPLKNASEELILNVDLLEAQLDLLLPGKNKETDGDEVYEELLAELFSVGIKTSKDLIALIEQGRPAFEAKEAQRVAQNKALAESDDPASWEDADRTIRDVFYTHVGLVRTAMHEVLEFDPG